MSYGIEIFDSLGTRTLGMNDFTYYKIFETDIPAAGSNTSIYPVVVPGYDSESCVVLFTPLNYIAGEQPGGLLPANGGGFVPVYKDLGGETVGVVRRSLASYFDDSNDRFVFYYTVTAPSRMQVYKFSGS